MSDAEVHRSMQIPNEPVQVREPLSAAPASTSRDWSVSKSKGEVAAVTDAVAIERKDETHNANSVRRTATACKPGPGAGRLEYSRE